jgi:amino acid permease
MKNPKHFKYALGFMQGIATTFYILIGGLIYYFAGSAVESPALRSITDDKIVKIAWGIALPTIVIAGVVNGAVACKYIYTRIWIGTNVIRQRSFKAYSSWTGIVATMWIVAWIIAESIPKFETLLTFLSALLCSLFSFSLPCVLWFHMNWNESWKGNWRKMFLAITNALIFAGGLVMMFMGMYSSSWSFAMGAAGRPFACSMLDARKPSATTKYL